MAAFILSWSQSKMYKAFTHFNEWSLQTGWLFADSGRALSEHHILFHGIINKEVSEKGLNYPE